MDIKLTIEKLIKYAEYHLFLDEYDKTYYRNIILGILKIDSPYIGQYNFDYIESMKVPDEILNELQEYLINNDFEDSQLIIDQIMGLLSPLPSQVNFLSKELENAKSGVGLDYLYNLSIKNNYVKKTSIDKNIYFKKEYDDNFLEITINLSKPEKNNKEIAKLLVKKDVKYPQCALCKENLGYFGRNDSPCRVNIRYLSFKLNDEKWFLQYSPYAYFYKHAIIINEKHKNMSINENTFSNLLEFIKQFPTFFIGSNADLPIVGGSILNHEHYQGGEHLLPLFYSKDRVICLKNENIKISILDWYNSTIRIESEDPDKVIKYSNLILEKWISYNNENLNIKSHTDLIRHSTITPIARKIDNVYSMNLILRNNRCDEKYPDGIFHAHREYHNIKQEGIGLIEAMGLFILPPRLKKEMSYIDEVLSNDDEVEKYFKKYPELIIHKEMIENLISTYGRCLTKEVRNSVIKDYIADTCKNILLNTAVFKNNVEGQKAFIEFVEEVIHDFKD